MVYMSSNKAELHDTICFGVPTLLYTNHMRQGRYARQGFTAYIRTGAYGYMISECNNECGGSYTYY